MPNIPSHPLKLLVVGSGGREHALCWKLAQSEQVGQIFCLPGNGGTALEKKTSNVEIDILDFPSISEFCLSNEIDLVVIGPDNPLAEGIVDYLQEKGLRVFGPTRQAAKLEWSKSHAKTFMARHSIPTPRFIVCQSNEEAQSELSNNPWAQVIKVDGLALGKGVFVCNSSEDAQLVCNDIFLENKFGEAAETLLLEEKIIGQELSLLLLCDGKTFTPLASSQDYKRRFDGDHGSNTGGMGAYSPVALHMQYQAIIEETILTPLKAALLSEDWQYRGVLYIGIIVGFSEQDRTIRPRVLEFNARFGDPETQAILPRLVSDLLPALWACTEGTLEEVPLAWTKEHSCCVVAVTELYPEKNSHGKSIKLTDLPVHSYIFQAGTKLLNRDLITSGGRILAVTSLGTNLQAAAEQSYSVISEISFNGMDYRRDIAKGSNPCR